MLTKAARGSINIQFKDDTTMVQEHNILTREKADQPGEYYVASVPPVVAPDPGEGFQWVKTDAAPPLDGGKISVENRTVNGNNITWIYEKQPTSTPVYGTLKIEVYLLESFMDPGSSITGDEFIQTVQQPDGTFKVPEDYTHDKLVDGRLKITLNPGPGNIWQPQGDGAPEVVPEETYFWVPVAGKSVPGPEITWKYLATKSETENGKLTIEFLGQDDQPLQDPVVVATNQKAAEPGYIVPGSQEAIPAPNGEDPYYYEWELVAGENAPALERGGSLDIAGVELTEKDVTWTYKKVYTTKVMNVLIQNLEGEVTQTIPVTIYLSADGTTYEIPENQEDIILDPLPDNQEWVKTGGDKCPEPEGLTVKLAGIKGLKGNETFKYRVFYIEGKIKLKFHDPDASDSANEWITKTVVTRKTLGADTFEVVEDQENVPIPVVIGGGYTWEPITEGAPPVVDKEVIVQNLTGLPQDVTYEYKRVVLASTLKVIFKDSDDTVLKEETYRSVAIPFQDDTHNPEDLYRVEAPDEPYPLLEAPEIDSAHEWVSEQDFQEPIVENKLDVNNIKMFPAEAELIYKKQKITGTLTVKFRRNDGTINEDENIILNTEKMSDKDAFYVVSDDSVIETPEPAYKYIWMPVEPAPELNWEGNLLVDSLKDIAEKDAVYIYEEFKVRDRAFIRFQDEDGNLMEEPKIAIGTERSKDENGNYLDTFQVLRTVEGTNLPATDEQAPEDFIWIPVDGAPEPDENGRIPLAGIDGLAEEDTIYTYQKFRVKSKVLIEFQDENETVIGETIEVPTERKVGEDTYTVPEDTADVALPDPGEGYKWIAKEGTPPEINRVNNTIKVAGEALLEKDHKWVYQKAEQDALEIILSDKDGTSEVNVDNVEITVDSESGTIVEQIPALREALQDQIPVTDEVSVIKVVIEEVKEAPELVESDQEKLDDRINYFFDIYFVIIHGEDNTETRIEGDNIAIKADLKITIGNSPQTEFKAYTVEGVDAPHTLAEIAGATRENQHQYVMEGPHFSIYVLSFAKPDPVTPDPEQPAADEKPDSGHTSYEIGITPSQYALRYPNRNLGLWALVDRKAEAKAPASEAKVDSAKANFTVTTSIPATGEARMPIPAILTMLGAAALLLLLKKKR